MKQNYSVVHFHVGRGGHSYNGGFKTFVDVEDMQSKGGLYGSESYSVISEDENGNPLPDEDWKFTDGGGNVILEGRKDIESKTGILEFDTIYDTDIFRYVDECDDDELDLLYEAVKSGRYYPFTDDDKEYIKTHSYTAIEETYEN